MPEVPALIKYDIKEFRFKKKELKVILGSLRQKLPILKTESNIFCVQIKSRSGSHQVQFLIFFELSKQGQKEVPTNMFT
jgi:hypothetical protein